MSILNEIDRIKGEVGTQTTLITEIINDLETKLNPTNQMQEKTVTPTATEQIVLPDEDYIGLTKVVVNGDTNLIPKNIKEGVTIFGTTGSIVIPENGEEMMF